MREDSRFSCGTRFNPTLPPSTASVEKVKVMVFIRDKRSVESLFEPRTFGFVD
jgi:hypothetical protein